MSIYAHFACHDYKQRFWLGKVIHQNYQPIYFHIGNDPVLHWQRDELNQIVCKFLADHTGHRLQVIMEYDMTDEFYDYQVIGDDISVQEYLKDWRGL